MNKTRPRRHGGFMQAAALGISFSIACVSAAAAQAERLAIESANPIVPEAEELNALERGRFAVLIDLDENLLYFKEGDVTLWSAPVGTGTGIHVITDDDRWEFSTPTGRFQVQYKERDPIWIAPDWYFVENNLPVPARDDPSRVLENTLGEAAVYISPSLAIHGTSRPELLGERVSHGCIRLENRYAIRLYNNVQVGTEVIIVGGEDVTKNARVVDLRDGYDPSLAPERRKTPPSVDQDWEDWKELDTPELLDELDAQLALRRDSRWDQVATLLVDRAAGDDEAALDGLLGRTSSLPSLAVEREWGTMLTELFRRNTVGTLEGLADLNLRQRQQVADLLVTSSVALFAGDLDSRAAPWPSIRIPLSLPSLRAQRGEEAVMAAELAHRSRVLDDLAAS